MTDEAESSSAPNDKLVVVRVKRKAFQSALDAFWLEISERPLKRPLIDFEKLSISASPANEELKSRRFFVQHVETVKSTEDSIDILQSFAQAGTDNAIKFRDQRHAFKDKKQSHLLSKAKQDQETLAKNARFEQIWRSRRDEKEAIQDEAYRLYDVVRIDSEETSKNVNMEKDLSVEDQESLCKVLPLLRELIPSAAEEIESDMSYAPGKDEFVYDLYAVNEDVNETEASLPFPLVQVDDDDGFYDGPDHSDYETDDSNAEDHPWNDYPDEESDEEEEESKTSGSESDELAIETNSEESAMVDDLGLNSEHEMNDSNYSYGDYDEVDQSAEEGGDDEDRRWACR